MGIIQVDDLILSTADKHRILVDRIEEGRYGLLVRGTFPEPCCDKPLDVHIWNQACGKMRYEGWCKTIPGGS